jgi:diguanylate cyclase (GGDEF)-like protein/PAS domain S-box-containing protein
MKSKRENAHDITLGKKIMKSPSQVQTVAREATSRLKAVTDNVPNIAIQGYNGDGEIVLWNPASEKLYGYKAADVIGKRAGSLTLSESESKKLKKFIKTTLEKKKSAPLKEWTVRTKKGEERFVLSSIFPVSMPEGETFIVCVDADITERKTADKRLDEMSQQIERFSQMTAELLFIEDEQELFDHIAQSVIDISDFNRVLISFFIEDPPYREIIGHEGVSKADLERVKKVEMPPEKYLVCFEKGIKIGNQSCYVPHRLKHILDQDAVIYGKKTYPRRKGRWHKEDNVFVAMKDTRGKIIGIISVDESKSGLVPTDDTVRPLETFANLISGHIQNRILERERKKSEVKYQELVSNVQIGIFRATPGGTLLEINPAGLDMFEYKDPESFLSLTAADLYENPEDREKYVKEMEDNGLVKNKEVSLKKKDGTPFWAAMTSTAIKDGEGIIMYYDTVVEDITERKKSQEKIEILSITDELTGLYNRRHFNQRLPEDIKKAETWKSYLAFIMIDVDDFKKYNDLYYHLKGDEILKEIARVIQHNIRQGHDWAARFGGEEFAIILPGSSASEAFIVAERIRKAFRKVEFKPIEKSVHKTISAGVAECHFPKREIPPDLKDKKYLINYEKIATELADLADKALFKAKKSGKDRVDISEKTIEPKYSIP